MHWGRRIRTPTVAARRRDAARQRAALLRRDPTAQPVVLGGRRTIAQSVWGQAWCDHLDALRDLANRLDRGRSYVRHDAVLDLRITAGRVEAQVLGSALYTVELTMQPLPEQRWQRLIDQTAGEVGSLLDLLAGRLSPAVMAPLADADGGLFPHLSELDFACSCPDWAHVCKHVAAAFYGVGARLDAAPELLFLLRGVDPADLLTAADAALPPGEDTFENDDLGDIFGISLDLSDEPSVPFSPPAVAPPPAEAPPQSAPASPPVDLVDSAVAALLAALHGARTPDEVPAAHEAAPRVHRSLLRGRCPSLEPLARLVPLLEPAAFHAALERWRTEVLAMPPRRRSLHWRLDAGRELPDPPLPAVVLQLQPSGALVLTGEAVPTVLGWLRPTTPYLLELTHLDHPAADAARSRLAAALERAPGSPALGTAVDEATTVLWTDQVSALGLPLTWPSPQILALRETPGDASVWLGKLGPAGCLQHALPSGPTTRLVLPSVPPRPDLSPFVDLSDRVFRAAGVRRQRDRKAWRQDAGTHVRGLKHLLNNGR
jgi:hypothetical protein